MVAGTTGTAVSNARSFFDGLARAIDMVVPVVGAGLAEAAGAPSADALERALRAAAGEPDAAGQDLFETADRLAASRGDTWVREQAARIVGRALLVPTPPLLALARARSRLVLTTNYDLAVEQAAAAAGVPAVTLRPVDLAVALTPPGNTLRVLHLHGTADRPDSVVLTAADYAAALGDEQLQFLVRALAASSRLLFLGHGLGPREKHLRRDVLWGSGAVAAAALPAGAGEHLLLTGTRNRADPALAAWSADLGSAGVRLLAFADPDRAYRFVNTAAHVLAGPSAVDAADVSPAVPSGRIDPHYVPMAVAPAADVATAYARGAYRARTWRDGDASADHLDAAVRRLLLVGGGGLGKTQELLQIAARNPLTALYKPLAGVRAPAVGLDPTAVFADWLSGAASADGRAPRLTGERLRDDALVLLLDGFDEVATADRPGVADVLNAVVAAYPQHRWVVSSRRTPDALPRLDGFDAWTMLPARAWLDAYSARRGVDPDDLRRLLRTAPGVDELASIPVYAAAVVRHAIGRAPLPPTPRELVLGLADDHLAARGGIPAAPGLVRLWLDRLALHLSLRGEHEIDVEDLLGLFLHADLPGLAPDRTLLEELATRALLVDDGAVARFPATVVQEARTARALRDAGDEGLRLLGTAVAVRVGTGQPGGGVGVVRSRWQNVLMLALPDAPAPWMSAVQAVDPVLAARLTPPTAPEQDRHAAVRTLWDAYADRKVWLDRGYDETRQSDAGALAALLGAGLPPGFADEIVRALTADEPTLRGNALEVLPAVLPLERALPLVRDKIRDSHPVVRRRAAVAAWHLRLSDLVDDLAAQGLVDPDETAAETLTDFAVDLAPAARRVQVAARLAEGPRTGPRALGRLIELVPRADLLAAVRHGRLGSAVLDALDGADEWDRTTVDWPRADVVALALAAADHPEALDGLERLEQALQSDPRAALAAWLTRPTAPTGRDYFVWRLIAARPDDDLRTLAGLLDGPAVDAPDRLLPGAALGPADPDAARTALAVVRGVLAARAAPQPVLPGRPARPPRPGLAELVAAGDRDGALRRPPPALHEPLGHEAEAALRRWTADALPGLISRLADGLPPDGPVAGTAVGRLLRWAAWADVAVPPGDWPHVARAVLRLPNADVASWARRQGSPAAWDALRPLAARWPAREALGLLRLAGTPWPDGLAGTVLGRLGDDGLGDDERLHAAWAVADHDEQAVRDWLPPDAPPWARPLRVRLGDPAVEQSLLSDLTAAPASWTRWPGRQEADWIRHVRSPESADAVEAAVRALLVEGTPLHDVDRALDALERCAGPGAVSRYERLAADPAVPSGRFLHHHRQRALDAAAEQAALRTVGEPADTARLVKDLLRGPASEPTEKT